MIGHAEAQKMVSEPVTLQESGIEPEFLSVAQVARRLGCSVSLVQKWRRLGWLAATRLGPPDVPVYGYRPADVERFVSERWNRQRGRPSLGQGGPAADPDGAAATAPPPGDAPEPSERLKPPRLQPVGEAPPAAVAPPPVIPAAAAPPAAPAAPAAPEPPLKTTGRPLVLWDADPRAGAAMVIARFPAEGAAAALGLATSWARRYGEIFLCEVPRPGGPPTVLAVWRRGERTAD
jgi:transposase-like protein